ncbi:MAG: 1-deoxy-D-xylulose-5-phosphate synthase, partial [Acidimicrobiia bacterium]|nr:1-deoxy-D-xylulose-5-phosphate synthase [Acidimicrobiia bacterium]
MPILDSVSSPADLRELDLPELSALADEIRTFIVEHMAQTGGHLSPNLGVVELTLALHRVFDSPKDPIVWDVGHQAYAQKIVTGRKDFSSLRQDDGLSGYPSREESPHDFVENSHASTSLSYAMGLVQARETEDGHVIAVIGDGAITGGMAYEALNHIAHEKPRGLIIILNDNGRSYAPTVGGLAEHLARLRVDPRYEDAKQALGSLLRRLPVVGEFAEETAMRFKESVKEMLATLTFFDVLGLKYTGPIDGHDQEWLEETLEHAKEFDEPV